MSVLDKYYKLSIDKLTRGEYLGEKCEYCGTLESRKDERCSKCGAEMKEPLCFIFGVPVYDSDDYIEAITSTGYIGYNR